MKKIGKWSDVPELIWTMNLTTKLTATNKWKTTEYNILNSKVIKIDDDTYREFWI